ncbi:MAG: hypothetical protein ABIA63_09990, partial [bacterium]
MKKILDFIVPFLVCLFITSALSITQNSADSSAPGKRSLEITPAPPLSNFNIIFLNQTAAAVSCTLTGLENLTADVESLGIYARENNSAAPGETPHSALDTVLLRSNYSNGDTIKISGLSWFTVYYFSSSAANISGEWDNPNAEWQVNTDMPPRGGYLVYDTLPVSVISQLRKDLVRIKFKILAKNLSSPCTLFNFSYSINNGGSWLVPSGGDNSTALSTGWIDNFGTAYNSGLFGFGFAQATEYSFNFNPLDSDAAADFAGISNNSVRIRFRVKDNIDAGDTVVSQAFTVDCRGPANMLKLNAQAISHNTINITVSNTGSLDGESDSVGIWWVKGGTSFIDDAENTEPLRIYKVSSLIASPTRAITGLEGAQLYKFSAAVKDSFQNWSLIDTAMATGNVDTATTNIPLDTFAPDNGWSLDNSAGGPDFNDVILRNVTAIESTDVAALGIWATIQGNTPAADPDLEIAVTFSELANYND